MCNLWVPYKFYQIQLALQPPIFNEVFAHLKTSCNGSFFFGLPRCHFEVLPGRCQDDPSFSWGRSGLNWLLLWRFVTSCNGSCFFLGSQGATLKFYLEGAKTIQVFLGEDLALNWLLLLRFMTSCNGSCFFGLPRCHFEVLPGRCQDDPSFSWGRSGLNWLLLWRLTSCNGSFVFGFPRCHFEVLPGRCQDDPGLSWGRSGLKLIAALTLHDVVQW